MELAMGAVGGREYFYNDAGNVVSCEESREELERVLTDPEFQCSERNKKFLRYIAKEGLAGRRDQLKGYTIAVDVFGRPDSFDASSDGIVRIEATRLRAALVRYYETTPSPIGIEIRMPRGHYAAEFIRVSKERSRNLPETAISTPRQGGSLPIKQRALPSSVIGRVLVIGAICALTGALFFYAGRKMRRRQGDGR